MTQGETWPQPDRERLNYRATAELRRRMGRHSYDDPTLEQKWVSDDGTHWVWRRVPLVPFEAPNEGP